MKHFAILLVLAGAPLAANLAEAAEHDIYVGGSMGQIQSDVGFGIGSAYDTSDSAYKLLAGARLLDWLAIEGSYSDLGRITFTGPILFDATYFYQDQKALSVSAVLLLGLRKIDLYAKAGLARWTIDGSHDSIAGPVDFSENGTDLAWGVGIQGTVADHVALRLEYERLEFDNFFTTFRTRKLLSVGFTWTFR